MGSPLPSRGKGERHGTGYRNRGLSAVGTSGRGTSARGCRGAGGLQARTRPGAARRLEVLGRVAVRACLAALLLEPISVPESELGELERRAGAAGHAQGRAEVKRRYPAASREVVPVQVFIPRETWTRALARLRQDAQRLGLVYGRGRPVKGQPRLYQADLFADLLRQYAEGITWYKREHFQKVKTWQDAAKR